MKQRRLLVFASLVAFLAGSASALATHQDPQRRLNKADSARARAMVVKRTDLTAGFRAQPSAGEDPHVDCSRSVGEADLTITGDAEGPQLAFGVSFVSSAARVFESVADASQALAPKVGLELVELEAVTCCGAGAIHEAEPDYYLHLNARILRVRGGDRNHSLSGLTSARRA